MPSSIEELASGRPVAQGDILILPVLQGDVPEGFTPVPTANGEWIVAHSETGHHHVLMERKSDAPRMQSSDSSVTLFRRQASADVEIESYVKAFDGAQIVHRRGWDTHETIDLPAGTFLIKRQQQPTPAGWRKVQD